MTDSARTWRWLSLILGVGLLLRAGAAWVVQWRVDADPTPGAICLIPGDATGYWELARALTAGQPYAIYDPPRRVLRMPGFPLLLAAGMKLCGERPLAIRMLLAVVGTMGCGFIFLLGKELVDGRTGLVAATLAAVTPAHVLFSVLILSEIPFATALTASLWLMARMIRLSAGRGTAWRLGGLAGGTGIAMGVATLVRPTWLLVAPACCGLWLLRERNRRTAALSLVILAGLGLALTPWTVRNYDATGGHFVPTTLWVGPSLYDGLHPQATGASDMRFIERDGVFRTQSEYEADHYYRRAAWKFARENPRRAVELGLKKLWRFWNPWPNAEQFSNPLIGLALAGPFLPTCLLAVYGIWQRRHAFWSLALPCAPILYFSAVHTLFIGSIRYRLPAEAPLLVLTAVGLLHLGVRYRGIPAAVAPETGSSPLA